jgi:hypothetical protein
MSLETHVVINPLDFDPSRLVIAPATFSSFKKGTQEFTNSTSEVLYKVGALDSGRTKKIYIQAPTQTVFGFSEQHQLGKPQTEEYFTGYQVAYPVSATTSPTEPEAAFIKMLDSVHAAVVEAGKREVAKHDELEAAGKPSKFPQNVISSYSNITRNGKLGDVNKFIKPLAEYPNVKDTKTKDMSKPKRMYIGLVSGKEKRQVLTKVFGPGGKNLNVANLISRPGEIKRGELTPVFEIKNVYWGGHGTNPQGGSVKFQLVQCSYKPSTGGASVPTMSLLPTLEGGDDDAESGDADEGDDGEDAFAAKGAATQSGSAMSLADAMSKVSVADSEAELVRPAPVSALATAAVAASDTGVAVAPKGKGKGKGKSADA